MQHNSKIKTSVVTTYDPRARKLVCFALWLLYILHLFHPLRVWPFSKVPSPEHIKKPETGMKTTRLSLPHLDKWQPYSER